MSSLQTRWCAALAASWLAAACAEDDDPCAPHGDRHGDHCHCDAPYRPSGLACVLPADASTGVDGAAPDASGTPDASGEADAATCRSEGPCTTDAECCEYCHDGDHCH